MTVLQVYYLHEDGSGGLLVDTLGDVRSVLDEIRADSFRLGVPLFSQWYVADDDTASELGVGVWGDRAILTYGYRSTHVSVGAEVAVESTATFAYMDVEILLPLSGLIAFVDAAAAVVEFFETGGRRPLGVPWRQITECGDLANGRTAAFAP